jgi:hypothetical protein
MNNKTVKTPSVLPWIPGGVEKKASYNKFVHKKSQLLQAGQDPDNIGGPSLFRANSYDPKLWKLQDREKGENEES